MARAAGLGVQLRLIWAGPLCDTYSYLLLLTLAHYDERPDYPLVTAYVRTVRADDHQAGDAIAPRDGRPQRLLLGPEAAVPAVSREARGVSGEPHAPCGLGSPLLERVARVS